MKIQVNTDKNIEGREKLTAYVESLITEGLSRFNENITKVEVHLSDENAGKEGTDDKKCLIEVRVEKVGPVVTSDLSTTLHKAIEGAISKMKHALESKLSKITQH